MRKFFSLLAFLFAFTSLYAQEYVESWREGYLDIHSIATGKGDASFVIMPDGTTMLIDAGDMTNDRFIAPALPNADKSPAYWISEYIKHFTKECPHPQTVDYFWLTHFHADHFGSPKAAKPGPHYNLCGIMEVGEYLRFNNIVDRDYPNYDFPSKEMIAKKCAKTLDDYKKFVAYHRDTYGTRPQKFEVGSVKQFRMLNDPKPYKKDFEITNLACNLEVLLPGGRKTQKLYQDRLEKLDENCFSGAVLVRYGDFTYFNGGDIGGSPSDERDVESYVADYCGPVTVMKANHHAWKDACNPYYMWKMRPDIIIVTASHVNHPFKETVRRVYDSQMPGKRKMYLTCDAAREQVGEELWKNIEPHYGHIMVRVYEGGKSWQLFVLDAYSTDYRIIYKSPVQWKK